MMPFLIKRGEKGKEVISLKELTLSGAFKELSKIFEISIKGNNTIILISSPNALMGYRAGSIKYSLNTLI